MRRKFVAIKYVEYAETNMLDIRKPYKVDVHCKTLMEENYNEFYEIDCSQEIQWLWFALVLAASLQNCLVLHYSWFS